jgi:hypothetical protein
MELGEHVTISQNKYEAGMGTGEITRVSGTHHALFKVYHEAERVIIMSRSTTSKKK